LIAHALAGTWQAGPPQQIEQEFKKLLESLLTDMKATGDDENEVTLFTDMVEAVSEFMHHAPATAADDVIGTFRACSDRCFELGKDGSASAARRICGYCQICQSAASRLIGAQGRVKACGNRKDVCDEALHLLDLLRVNDAGVQETVLVGVIRLVDEMWADF
jgi:hypothetical protein